MNLNSLGEVKFQGFRFQGENDVEKQQSNFHRLGVSLKK
jgi:hypothetical protein